MNDQYSREEWMEFLTGMGMEENQMEILVENQIHAEEFFENLKANLASELSTSLDIKLPKGYAIGKFQITDEIGKGGMAVVYKARRNDNLFEQEVAIKLLSPVLSTEQYENYFNSERKLLASLNHPNIAKIFDGGVTEEIPYFIMEYIEGKPINEYCLQENLTIPQLLKAVVQVCRAVQHAHNNFILHRDIKPSNILISSNGEIKLLDFGIGKFWGDPFGNQDYSFGGTLKYTPPEQLGRETLSTQSDIYQVGVLLYELLTNRVPFESEERFRVIEAITKGNFPQPNKLNPKISSDLNAIVLKCMATKPSERYSSVTAVIADLNNYLTNHPVSAQSADWRYSTGLFLKRNKVTSSLIALIVLISTGAAILTQLQINKTEQERQKVLAANKFLTKIFEANNPNLIQGEEVTAATLLRNSEKEISDIKDPEFKAYTQNQLGSLYESLGLWEESGPLFLNSLKNYQENNPENHYLDIANAYNHVAGYYRNISEHEKADSTFQIAINMLEQTKEDYPVALAASYQDHAHLLYQLGNYKEGELQVQKAIRLLQDAIANNHQEEGYSKRKEIELAFSYNTLSSLLREQSKYEQALEASKKAVEIGKHYANEDISVKLVPLNNLALAYRRLGQHDKEIEILSGILQEHIDIYGFDNPATISAYANLGGAHYKAGNILKSDSLNKLAYEAYLEKFGPYHNYTVSTLYNLANSKFAQSEFAEARDYYKKVLEADLQNFGNDHPYVAGDFVSLGLVEKSLGNYASAEKLFKDAFEIYYAKFGEQHQKISFVHSLIGSLYSATGKLKKAEIHYKKAIQISEEVLGKEHRYYKEYVQELDELQSNS